MNDAQLVERLNFLGERISFINASDRMSPAEKVELDNRKQEYRELRNEAAQRDIDFRPNPNWLT